MSRNRIIYNAIGTFVSSNVSSGFSFLTADGTPINSFSHLSDFNLIFPLHRTYSASYGFNHNRVDIKSLGNFGTVSRPITSSPDVNLSLNYYQAGIINELRAGIAANYPGSGVIGNPALYGTGRISPIYHLINRTSDKGIDNSIGWPPLKREPKSVFIATKKDNLDLNSTGNNFSYYSDNVDCFAFGDCYLTNYKTQCSIGTIPQCSMDFICSNVMFYDNGSGQNIPSINPKDNTLRSGIIFNLPNNFEGDNLPTVLLPKDINLSISLYDDSSLTGNNLPLNFNDIKIQGYDITLDFPREPLHSLGYKSPLDRRINFPIYANLNFNVIAGDNNTGSLINHVIQDKEYDINIKLNYQVNQQSGMTAINYDFIGAKFNGINLSESVQDKRVATFSFTSELKVNDLRKGFFISGQLGIPTGFYPSTGVLLDEDGEPLLLEDGDMMQIDTYDNKLLF